MTTASRAGRAATLAWIVVFAGSIVLSNWALLHIGASGAPGAPRTIPLGFGLDAPSGVLFAGAILTLRDLIHERIGTTGTLVVIAASAPIVAVTSNPGLALASAATFLAAEVADLVVYRRVRARGRVLAVLSSNVVSSIVDSVLFLALAFGAAAVLHGAVAMTVGKLAASVLTLALLAFVARVVRGRARHEARIPS